MQTRQYAYDVYGHDTGRTNYFQDAAKNLNQATADLAEIRKTREPTAEDYATIKAKYGVTPAPPKKSLLGKIGSVVGSAAKAAGSVAKAAGSVASYVPGVGTAVGAGLKIAGAAASGENVAKAAVNAAKTSVPYATMAVQAANLASDIARGKNVAGALKARASEAALSQIPGGAYGRQLAASVANVAAAGIKGQNLVKAGAREVVASAVAMAPAVSRETLNAAINAAASGQNPLRGAAASAVRSALDQIPDSAARKTAEDALSGVNAAKVLAQAPKGLLAKAAAAVPGGGADTAIQAITGKDSLMNVHRPILTSVTSSRPIFFDRASVAKTKSGVNHVPMSGAAKDYVRARAGLLARDAAGLRADGKWLVTKGDTGESIAFALTGVKSRWTELKAANPTIMKARAADAKKYGFPIYVNDVINIPAGWVQATTTPAATATTTQAPATTTAPTVVNPIQTAIQTVQTVLAPNGDAAAQAAARATLAAWNKTDGANRAGVTDYGSATEAQATSWTARDKLEAASFQSWANSVGLSTGATTGDWTQELSNALRSWAEHKATQVLTPAATVATAPAATVYSTGDKSDTPAVTVTPGVANGSVISLPGITVTPATATSSTAKKTDSTPTFWESNKAQIVSGMAGVAVALGAKFIH